MADFKKLSMKLMALKHLKIEKGHIWLYGIPSLFITPASCAAIQKAIERVMGEIEGSKEMYSIFIEAGKELAKMVEKGANRKEGELVSYITPLSSIGGWGEWGEVYMNYKKLEAIYTLKEFLVPVYMGSSKRPSCDVVRGLIGGVWRYASKKELDCIETSCRSQGFSECTFMVGMKKQLEKKHMKLVKEQLH